MHPEDTTLTGIFSNIATYVVLAVVSIGFLFWKDYARLRHIPGPLIYALTRYRLSLDAWNSRYVTAIHKLHDKYGPVVRVEPNQVSFNSLAALRTIYGAGSGFERTNFYDMFISYGHSNMFSFASGKRHRDRKKLISNIYANQTVLGPQTSTMIQSKIATFLNYLESRPGQACEVFSALHYFAFDTISEFIYGPQHGATKAMLGNQKDQDLIKDILVPGRRHLAWYTTQFPAYTRWLTTRTGLLGELVDALHLMPMKKPYTYTGARQHALNSMNSFRDALASGTVQADDSTVIGRLYKARKQADLSDLQIASECADHLTAGIDTTSDTIMFLMWAVSLPQHQHIQAKLREEVRNVKVNEHGVPYPRELTQLPYLNAVLRETLRLYAPLPTFEPRSSPVATVVDGYHIPAGTVVGISPYTLHRDPKVFPSPLSFQPERWLIHDDATGATTLVPESDLRHRYFWAFSSGARMCIGMHLAFAEMTTLVTAVYRQYRTVARNPDTSPAITSRFEVFYDESAPKIQEHECWIEFVKADD
ncbi:hypothetical protein ABEF95_015292 [Exophiala dermatitidis]